MDDKQSQDEQTLDESQIQSKQESLEGDKSDTLSEATKPLGTKLAQEHWSYLRALLKAHEVQSIDKIEFHYKSAFIHGFKHGVDSTLNDRLGDKG